MIAGALVGGGIATGVVVVAVGLRSYRRPRLVDRMRVHHRAPDVGRPLSPLAVLTALAPRIHRDHVRLVDRLTRAGRAPDLGRHLLDQVVWGAAGACLGLVFGLALGGGGVSLALAGLAALAGVLIHGQLLTRAGRQRAKRMAAQLPAVADLLAFAVSAGMPPLQALDRVSQAVRGDLSDQIAAAVADVRVGASFHDALRALAAHSASAEVQRFVDGILVAVDRGTPLAEVLRAQAADARGAGRRALLELAGKREVAMLVPVVFFVLPIVVVIALFPGLHGLQLSVP
jgi:tight adherence protein C